MAQLFEFDPAKADANKRKHSVGFEEAQTCFADAFGLDMPDAGHSRQEERFIRLAMSAGGRLLTTVYSERDDDDNTIIRLISSRASTRRETAAYVKKRGLA